MINSVIKSIGAEFECGMSASNLRKVRDSDLFYIGSDGSVNTGAEKDGIELKWWSEHKDVLMNKATELYSYRPVGNSSCGLHIHTKFVDEQKAFFVFSTKKAQERYIAEYDKKFGNNPKYKNRLSGRYSGYNGYDFTLTLRQTSESYKSGSRYSALNLNSYRKLGTIEFRIYPYQETLGEFEETINWHIDTITKIMKEYGKNLVVEIRDGLKEVYD